MTFTVTIPNLQGARSGVVSPLASNYASGTGTAGTDNTAQTVLSITIPANALHEVGDRIRLRAYWTGDTGTAITGNLVIGAATISSTTDLGGATLQIDDVWLHYIDNTHANVIAMSGGALDLAISAVNQAGFDWAADTTVNFKQTAALGNHCTVYLFAGDVFPLGNLV